MPQQWVPAGLAPIEGIERMNATMVIPQQRAGFPARNLYAMDVDRNDRMCYTCEGFGHMAKNCRNRGRNLNQRMEMEDNSNLKEGWDLIVFD